LGIVRGDSLGFLADLFGSLGSLQLCVLLGVINLNFQDVKVRVAVELRLLRRLGRSLDFFAGAGVGGVASLEFAPDGVFSFEGSLPTASDTSGETVCSGPMMRTSGSEFLASSSFVFSDADGLSSFEADFSSSSFRQGHLIGQHLTTSELDKLINAFLCFCVGWTWTKVF
jgi:hypothetical protein